MLCSSNMTRGRRVRSELRLYVRWKRLYCARVALGRCPCRLLAVVGARRPRRPPGVGAPRISSQNCRANSNSVSMFPGFCSLRCPPGLQHAPVPPSFPATHSPSNAPRGSCACLDKQCRTAIIGATRTHEVEQRARTRGARFGLRIVRDTQVQPVRSGRVPRLQLLPPWRCVGRRVRRRRYGCTRCRELHLCSGLHRLSGKAQADPGRQAQAERNPKTIGAYRYHRDAIIGASTPRFSKHRTGVSSVEARP